jgi:hypothetical protein
MRKRSFSLILLAALALPSAASASLINRGGGLIYDTVLDITWLQDANYAQTSGFDADGLMTWANAVAWADQLVFGGFDDWRLPLTPQPDPSCDSQASFTGSPDQGSGLGCTGSEMGHLFNVDGISPGSPGPFTNVQLDDYWSGSEFAPVPSDAWIFSFNFSTQVALDKSFELFAWAVRPGDVVAQGVPEPGTAVLLGAALGLLGWRSRARRHSMLRSLG